MSSRLLYAFFFVVPLVLIAGIPVLLWALPPDPVPETKLLNWVVAMIALTVFVFTLGYRIKGRLLGALIDERNHMSLSRLQLIVSTVVIISGYFTAALWNLFATNEGDPLAVRWPQEHWWLLGISTTSFVGSPLILNAKKNQDANSKEREDNIQKLAVQQGPAPGQIHAVGQVLVNETPRQARLTDMFTGDEVGNGPTSTWARYSCSSSSSS